ncbi:hypothetical protein JW711_00675 [Candidatus Woesearchaeota archaeon]|nr:hypothetical protein [Candidatus Woesearchaeota archaeon]
MEQVKGYDAVSGTGAVTGSVEDKLYEPTKAIEGMPLFSVREIDPHTVVLDFNYKMKPGAMNGEFNAFCHQYGGNGMRNLVLNMKNARNVDDFGLGYLVRCRARLMRSYPDGSVHPSISFRLCNVSGHTKKFMSLHKVDDLILHETLEDALKASQTLK